MSGRTHVVWPLDHPGSEPVGKVAASKSATPISVEASATLKIQMQPSFDALNMPITAPSRIRSRAFAAMIKANPTVLRRTVVRRTRAATRMGAMQLARIREQPLSKNSWSTTCDKASPAHCEVGLRGGSCGGEETSPRHQEQLPHRDEVWSSYRTLCIAPYLS